MRIAGCEISRIRLWQALSFAITFAILVVMSRGLCDWLVRFVFNEPREDMSHGWLVPLFSIAILWMKRRELIRAAGAPSWTGLLLAIPGFFFFLLGTLGDQVRITQIGAIWLLWTVFYAIWGRKFGKAVAFPVAFLLFTVPMSFLDAFTVKLRVVITALASGLLNGFGIPVQRVGTGLYCLSGGGFNLDVADPCSGLRSIFALTALTAAYAYLTQKTLRGKWLLFLCSAPVAMLGNLARIFSIALVARFAGEEAATGFYHDYSGYVVFLVAVMTITWLGGIISRHIHGREALAQREVAVDASPPRFGLRQVSVLVVLPLVMLASLLHIGNAPAPVQESDDFLVSRLGALQDYTARYPFFCQNDQCGAEVETDSLDAPPGKCPHCGGEMLPISLGEKTILPADTRIMKCNYYDDMGDAWRISVVVNGRSRQSIHRPEICLPAQGMSLEKGHVDSFRLASGTVLSMHCYDVRSRMSSSGNRMGFGYFFMNPRGRAASHLKRILISVRDRAFSRRVTRWAMVTISGEESFTATEGRKEATSAFLSEFYEMVVADDERSVGK